VALTCTDVGPHLAKAAEPEGVVGHWLFEPGRLEGNTLKALAGPDGTPEGLGRSVRFVESSGPGHAEFLGQRSRIEVSPNIARLGLPNRELTLEAWVSVEKPMEWGGIIGAVQDNGSYEKGWLLGFRKDRFCFAVHTEGHRSLTYLTADRAFEPGRWYHVAGVYDGTTQRIYVDGELAGESTDQQGEIVYPPKAWLTLGAYQDDDEFFSMTGRLHEVRLLGSALSAAEVAKRHLSKRDAFPKPAPKPKLLAIAYGPFVDWVDRTTATISWEVDEVMEGRVRWSMPSGQSVELSSGQNGTRHLLTVRDLVLDGEYRYQILGSADGRPVESKPYKFDSSFYYRLPAAPLGQAEITKRPNLPQLVEQILELADARAGYALVLAGVDGSLALELVRQSDLQVVVLEQDAERVKAIRAVLDDAGVYGVRASVLGGSLGERTLGPMLFNLIVSERHLLGGQLPAATGAETLRSLAPSGGTLVLGPVDDLGPVQRWLGQAGSRLVRSERGEARWLVHERPGLAGAGEWTHQYGNAQNTSCSGDDLVKGEMGVKWWGEPGPRPMPDRGPRNPAPLSANGRLFIQGDRMLFGLDAYNGTVLWSFSSPEMRRANIPRDSSNMVAAEERLYLVQGRYCIGIDGATGERAVRFQVDDGRQHDWAYLAVVDDVLIGSRVKNGAVYHGDDGQWFENFAADDISRVTSDRLFGVDPKSGERAWEYYGGAIVNSTITIGDGMVYFIESRAGAAVEKAGTIQPIQRLGDQHLVALDLRTGEPKWNRAHDFSRLQYMTYLVYADGTLVATGTDKDKRFHTYAIAAIEKAVETQDGERTFVPPGSLIWEDHHTAGKDHHSGHLQHPVIIGNTFFSDQWAFDLRTGKQVRDDLPERRGCGTMSASNHSLFFRHYFHGMWNLDTNKRSQFEGIRSGCWLGLIPAGGMLLAPETSAGCSCTHSIQTSVGYLPRAME
jgi:outer membrane protein assembly factor BamB